MVFSFFKKDPKDPRKGASGQPRQSPSGSRTGGATSVQTRPNPKPIGRPLAGPVNRSLSRPTSPTTAFPLTETAMPEREQARSRALETAAKIDAIESEMARDLMRGLGRSTDAPAPASAQGSKPAQAKGGRSAQGQSGNAAAAPLRPNASEEPESTTDILGGDIDAIEINTSGAGSVIDETAILFSNGQAEEAEAVLRAGLRGQDLGQATRMAWHMLFELVNQRGDKAAFEQLSMDFVLRFEHSPPGWIDYQAAPAVVMAPKVTAPPAPTGGPPGLRLPESIDAGIVTHLEQLRSLTASHAAVQLDVSDARRIDIAGAELMLRVLNAFKRSNHELTLLGAEPFAAMLAGSIEPGRRDAADSVWMLLLEVQRLLGQQDEFDETAIQYCITFEVSPPSWEPAPANLKVGAATAAISGSVAVSVTDTAASAFALRGVIDGEGEPHFGRLVAAARNQPQVVIDCMQLRRMAFSSGSAMIGMLRKMQQGGSAVELRNVNSLVAALLHLLGITTLISVQARRG